ncbi:MAG: PEP-CTERM sorting domain-containing protein [Planctomycetota bacterium]
MEITPRLTGEKLVATVALILAATVASAGTVYQVNTTGDTTLGSKNNAGVYSGYNSQEGGNVDNGLHGATITAVPEPSTHLAVGIAVAGIWLLARRRNAPR